MSSFEHRYIPLDDLEIRASAREITGVVVPFGAPTRIGDYLETFVRGAFTRTIAERGHRVKLLFSHDPTRPLGKAVLLTEELRGLIGTFKVARTTAGDEALELASSGALDSLSVGFQPIRDNWSKDRTLCDRLEVRLHEASLVAFPAYDGALVESVRSLDPYNPQHDPRILRARLALTH